MKTEFQDLEWGRPLIRARVKKNRNQGTTASLSGLFTMLRRHPRLTLIGDYPLFWLIVDETKSTTSLKGALHKSEEYRQLRKAEKMQWFRMLPGSLSK